MTDSDKTAQMSTTPPAEGPWRRRWPFPAGDHQAASRDAGPTPQRVSESGAVLGRPGKEFGAYGMVKGERDDQTPSDRERRIRGVKP